MKEYPKIETLFNRDPKNFKIMTNSVRLPEFRIVNRWYVTEKIDGTNVRIMWKPDEYRVIFGGRTNYAQIPINLILYLQSTFTPDLFSSFNKDMILFGEGYGEKIQKGGGNYCNGVSFRLFDVLIGEWWLEPESIAVISTELGIKTVPDLGILKVLPTTKEELYSIVGTNSAVSRMESDTIHEPEGIVARSNPLLFTRRGDRLMWKLKFKDFA